MACGTPGCRRARSCPGTRRRRWSCRTSTKSSPAAIWPAAAVDAPIASALEPFVAALRSKGVAVLSAAPGAGKSTIAPLALLGEPWVGGGKILLLEPRRLAARAVAARMAATLGEEVGQTVGYRVRLETRVSPRTRLEVVTEGIFTRMILDDAALEGVAAVLFDEFHERSLEADLGLALAWQARSVLRPDLRIAVMSATLDIDAIARLLDDAPTVVSQGRGFAVETRYVGRDPAAPFEAQVERTVRRALDATQGDVLVFLPGLSEIGRVRRAFEGRPLAGDIDLMELHGGLDLEKQAAVLEPAGPGRRKVVLATSIAETSLTVPGVGAVVDSGLARTSLWDPGTGVERLVTKRVSRAAAEQRRGRAGRTGPGLCWRLWDVEEDRGLDPFEPPEIRRADLSRLALTLAQWGAADGEDLAFLDPPSAPALAEARRGLRRLDALDENGAITARGAALARLALPPRLGHLVLLGAERGCAHRAARLALVISEPGLGGAGLDLSERVARVEAERGGRARRGLAQAQGWAQDAIIATGTGREQGADLSDGLLIAAAYPDWIARRGEGEGEFRLANGRGASVPPTDALARASWLAVADLGPGRPRDRIRLATPLDLQGLRRDAPHLFDQEVRLQRSPSGRRRAQRVERLGGLETGLVDLGDASGELVLADLLAEVRERGLASLPWRLEAAHLLARGRFLSRGEPEGVNLSDEALLERLEFWLGPSLEGAASLDALTPTRLAEAVRGLFSPTLAARLPREAPSHWVSPAGLSHPIAYDVDGGPRVEARVQALYGLTRHPTVGRGEPLVLVLLSPAGRPIQVTRDLPGFWRGAWADVRKDMRGRYPKHDWPERPDLATPRARPGKTQDLKA
ncbi:MAG: ATP-dependent helicase HrpB [Alphaproteobacteria bacterium]|nr:ATP-dependent helicase HrpB [Alphaproteobacteria bacterium]